LPSGPQIFVCGHRNPDIDSIAGAVALAELRSRQGYENITALCPGILPDRAAFLLRRFNVQAPPCRNDVYVRVQDIMENVPVITSGCTLFDAVGALRESGFSRLPVVDENGGFLGMLSCMALLDNLLSIGNDAAFMIDIAKQKVGNLSSDAGEREKIVHIIGYLTAKLISHYRTSRLDAFGFRAI
jgi:hypothetical protein